MMGAAEAAAAAASIIIDLLLLLCPPSHNHTCNTTRSNTTCSCYNSLQTWQQRATDEGPQLACSQTISRGGNPGAAPPPTGLGRRKRAWQVAVPRRTLASRTLPLTNMWSTFGKSVRNIMWGSLKYSMQVLGGLATSLTPMMRWIFSPGSLQTWVPHFLTFTSLLLWRRKRGK